MKKVNIVYLAHRRMEYSDLLFLILSKCKFKDFHITICVMNVAKERAEKIKYNAINNYNLDADLFITYEDRLNYLDKIKTCTNNNYQDYQYSIKLDEDIFMGPQAWDYFFDNLNLLDNDENLLLSPALSSGIPTVDSFVNYNLNESQKKEINKLFATTKMGISWEKDYSCLNVALGNDYNSDVFFNQVRDYQHAYKGIHPIRVNILAQSKLNEFIKDNIEMFFENREYIIENLDRPYFCNSIFAIKTRKWKNILDQSENKNLFIDNFDEVPLNVIRDRDPVNNKFLFITNIFGIHTLYNTLWEYNNFDVVNNMESNFYNYIRNYVFKILK